MRALDRRHWTATVGITAVIVSVTALFLTQKNELATGHESTGSTVSTSSVNWAQSSGGPLGGTVTKMALVNGKPWAALYSGGIYQLNGVSWEQIGIGHGLPENRGADFTPDPTNSSSIYVPQVIACAARSQNGGGSWTGLCPQINAATDSPNFTANTIALDPADPTTLYLPGNVHDGTSVLLVSANRGDSWEKRFTFPEHLDFNSLVFYGGKMYLGTRENGVNVSEDHGQSWNELSGGLSERQTIRLLEFKGRLYLATGLFQFNVRELGALYRLNTDGTGWEHLKTPAGVTGIATDGSSLLIGQVNGKISRSSNGTNFTVIAGAGLPETDIGEMILSGKTIYAGAGGYGIYRSTNAGKSFQEFNRGLRAIATREVHVDPANSNEIYVVTWDRPGIYLSANGGKKFALYGDQYNILTAQPFPDDFDSAYVAGDKFMKLKLKKKGAGFTKLKKPGPSGSLVKSLAIKPNDSQVVIAGVAKETAESPPGYGAWLSSNGGRSWKRAKGIGNSAVYSIIFNPKKPKIVFASALGGGVFKSSNGGRSFSSVGPPGLKYTYRLSMSASDPNHLVAGSNLFFAGLSDQEQISGNYGGIFETRDGGGTWQEITAGIRKYGEAASETAFEGWLYNFGHLVNYEQIVIDPTNASHIIVGHHGESAVSTTDGGQTWQKQSTGMIPDSMHNYAYCLGLGKKSKQLYGCTCGRGLFKGSVNTLTGQIAWHQTGEVVPAPLTINMKTTGNTSPKSAAEARVQILSGEYNHLH